MHHLEDALRAREVAQTHRAQVAERHTRGRAVDQQHRQRLRHQHLAAMRRRHDARGAVHHAAEEIVVAALDDAGVQTAARPQRNAVDARIGECLLELQSGRDRVLRVVEGGVHAVARHLDHAAAMRVDRGPRQVIVPGQRGLHALRLALPQLGAAFDIGKEEGRDRGMIVHAGAPEAANAEGVLYGRGGHSASHLEQDSRLMSWDGEERPEDE